MKTEMMSHCANASLKFMAEQLEGSFTITVMDKENNLYFIKGDNPMCIYHFKDMGVYIYASTEEVLLKALNKMPLKFGKPKKVDIKCGEILVIDKHGSRTCSVFDTENLSSYSYYKYWWRGYSPERKETSKKEKIL